MSRSKFTYALIIGSSAVVGTSSARADAVADFYRNKQVQFLISHPVGGGFDVYARFFTRHLPRFLVGNPNVVPQNMPGAAGVVMANSMAAQQPNDGSVIGLGPGSTATANIFGAPGARYDARKFSWIGSMNSDTGVAIAWHTSPVKNAEDLMRTELIVGGGGATDSSVAIPTLLNNVLGTKFKIIVGYGGSAGTSLAMERGETQGVGGMNYSSIHARKPEWLRDNKINILVQLAFERHAELPNVPTVMELAKNDEQRAILQLVFAPTSMSHAIFGPPGIPADRLKALRTAFDTMMSDKGFLAEADKLKIEINQPMSGEKMSQIVERLYNVSPELLEKAKAAIKTN